MSRRTGGRKPPEGLWLMTFTDLMTLLLTLFVLLLSMAVIDERARRIVLGAVSQGFGLNADIYNPLSPKDTGAPVEPGSMELPQKDLAALRDKIFDDASQDLDFQENKYIQILSINDQVLFQTGQTTLSPAGVALLDKLLPYLQNLEHPLLVAGHTAPRRDEEGAVYRVGFADQGADSTWILSFRRASAVYRHLVSRGIPPETLLLEAFGQFHPRHANTTPEGRRKNRRVDLVLDKRNREWIRKIQALRETGKLPRQAPIHYYKGFRFDLTLPGNGSRENP
ncbi:MAG: OmpA family protein [Desulfovibrio sp.]|jgi:chemotaxis protein MotB|nr:OmpA family protein [Desulfovibrio sp.]